MADVETTVTADQAGQVADMLGDFVGETKLSEESKEGEPKEEQKVGSEGTPKDEPKPDVKDDTIKTLMDQVKILTEQVSKLNKPIESVKKAEEKPPEPTVLGFFKNAEEYEETFKKPEAMNEVLSRVRRSTIEEVLKVVPQIISKTVETQMVIRGKISDFYKENESLKEHKDFVKYIANDLTGKNPDWTLDKLFQELPGEVSKRIGLKKEADKKVADKKPGFAPAKGGSRKPAQPDEKLSTLEQEIQDLMP